MKKIYYILILMATFLISSCNPVQDQIFEEPSAQRVEKAIKEVHQQLQSNADGWLFKIYTTDYENYGGFNTIVKFTDEASTTVYNPRVENGKAFTSEYTLKQYGGVLLSFDTYNKAMHYFSDPINPDGIGDRSKGLEGDFEFVIMDRTEDKIVLRGLKSNALCELSRLPSGTDPATFLSNLNTMTENIKAPTYDLYIGGNKVDGFLGNGIKFSFTTKVNGEDENLTFSIVPTTEGIQTYQPIYCDLIGKDKMMQNFKFDEKNDRFVCTDPGIEAYIQKIFPPINAVFANTATQWFFNGDRTGSASDRLSSTFAAKLKAALTSYGSKHETIKNLYIGQSPINDFPGFSFILYTSYGSSSYNFIWKLTPSIVEGTTDELMFSNLELSLNASYLKGVTAFLTELISKSPYKLTSNQKDPQTIRFTSKADADYWFELDK